MNSQNELETTGDLRNNSLAELLAEIGQLKFNGALRLSNGADKIAVYFDAGEAVFAASNARRHRLFEILLQAGKITRDQLVTIPEFTNDLALKEFLRRHEAYEAAQLDQLFSRQIDEILKTALDWRAGEWTFSPLVRVKGDIRFALDLRRRLLEHARRLPPAEISRKFAYAQESFAAKAAGFDGVDLTTRESFVFSRFDAADLTVEQLQAVSGLPEAETRQIVYALWLGGLLARRNWNQAFSEKKIAAIRAARLALKKSEPAARAPVVPFAPPSAAANGAPAKAESQTETVSETAPEPALTLDDYLTRVENAPSFYDLFAVASGAQAAEIKRVYFNLAKRFHPDLFHKEADAAHLQRIQAAFTKLAHAYDTLKDTDSRELYDFRMRKELADRRAVERAETTVEEIDRQKQTDEAAENFERGFSLLMDGDGSGAIPLLARAALSAPTNARHRAYYGKALATDARQRHKAESELQAAVRLDQHNADYRLMLAEFFIQHNLLKRAEGELNRLLKIAPNHGEAKRLLDSVLKK